MNQSLSTALKFADLCVTLNHAEILRGISGEFRRGEVTGFLGPNGCGKTTLLRALCRLIKADSGSITLCDGAAETDIAALAPKALAQRVSFLPQQRAVPDITVKTLDFKANGAVTQCSLNAELLAGTRQFTELRLDADSCTQNGITELKDLSFYFSVCDLMTWNEITKSDTVTLEL